MAGEGEDRPLPHGTSSLDAPPGTYVGVTRGPQPGLKGLLSWVCCAGCRWVQNRPAVKSLLAPAKVAPGQHSHIFPLHRMQAWEQVIIADY